VLDDCRGVNGFGSHGERVSGENNNLQHISGMTPDQRTELTEQFARPPYRDRGTVGGGGKSSGRFPGWRGGSEAYWTFLATAGMRYEIPPDALGCLTLRTPYPFAPGAVVEMVAVSSRRGPALTPISFGISTCEAEGHGSSAGVMLDVAWEVVGGTRDRRTVWRYPCRR